MQGYDVYFSVVSKFYNLLKYVGVLLKVFQDVIEVKILPDRRERIAQTSQNRVKTDTRGILSVKIFSVAIDIHPILILQYYVGFLT